MGVIENNSHLENTGKDRTVQKEILPKEKIHTPEHPAHQQEIQTKTDTPTASFEKSGLRLVTDLQRCIKAQQSKAYANKVKLSNLQNMAKTLSYIQEHGYNTRDSLEDSFSEIKSHASTSRKELKSVEDNLRKVNEQIHYTGQYLANKPVYQKFVKAKNKGQFRQEHPMEIALYEAARKFLKEQSENGKLPSMKLLKAEKEKLLQQKTCFCNLCLFCFL